MTEGQKPKQLLSVIFIFAIALVFTLNFGPGSKGCESKTNLAAAQAAATVNGKEIPIRDFQRQYQSQLRYMQAMGQPIPDSLARQIGLPKQVLDRLVDAELLAQAADKAGISASDAEIREELFKNPDFQKDGVFDQKTYFNNVRDYYKRTPTEYETELRRSAAARKLLQVVEGAAVVSDEEVKTRYQKEGNRATATYVRFLPSQFADKVKITDAEAAAYAKANEAAVKDYYEKNKFLYHQNEQVRARHILIRSEKESTDAQKAEAKAKAENLRKEVVDNKKDFAEIAKQFSEDPGSKESGGDLGFNEAGSWVPEFSEAAFKLQPGQISDVVQTPFGFHVIKVEERKPPTSKELKEVEVEIARTLMSKDKAKELAKAAAEAALVQAKAGKKLGELFPAKAEANSNPWETPATPEATDTGEFDQTSISLPKLGAAPDVTGDIFKRTEPGLLDKVYSVQDAYVVVDVTSRSQPSDEKFVEAKDQLREEALRAKQIELREAYLKALRKQAQIVTNDAAINGSGQGAGQS